MKQFEVPLIQRQFRVYHGEDGRKQWEKATGETTDGSLGVYCGFHVWVHDLADTETLAHELSHLVDGIMVWMKAGRNEEMRARVSAWVYTHVLKWQREKTQ